MAKNSQLVYSSGTGYIHVNNKNQKQPQSTTAKDSNARVRLEQKGRGGKTVTP
jgi:translation initiation factor 1 (eIF-1/SUI1)